MSSAKKITLKSSDGELFEVEEAVAAMFSAFNPAADNNLASCTEVTIGELTGDILAMVIEYCEKQADTAASDEPHCESLKKWEADFVDVDMEILLELSSAADILKTESLKDLITRAIVKERQEIEEEKIFRENLIWGLRKRKFY